MVALSTHSALSSTSTCQGCALDHGMESEAVALAHARRRAIAGSPIFARIWRVAVQLREAQTALGKLRDDLEEDTVAKILKEAGLPAAEAEEPFGADVFSETSADLAVIDNAIYENLIPIFATIAIVAAPEAPRAATHRDLPHDASACL